MLCPSCRTEASVGGVTDDLATKIEQKVQEKVYPALGASLVAGAAFGLFVGYVLWKK